MTPLGPLATMVMSGMLAQAPLPGAAGPRLELGHKPPRAIEIVDAFVYATPEQAASGVARPQRFPADTSLLWLDVRTKTLPSLGATFRFTLRTSSGAVDLVDALVTFARLPTVGLASTVFELRPRAGRFADGPYQLELFIDEVLVATLNWSVGG